MNYFTRVATPLFLALFLFSCARKVMFVKSVVMPSANGQVKVKKDNNDNYNIRVSIRDLTEPENLTPPKKSYVVWSQTKKHGIVSLGQINTSRSIMARGFKASLTSVSRYAPKRIFITAEENSKVVEPGTTVVLTTEDFR